MYDDSVLFPCTCYKCHSLVILDPIWKKCGQKCKKKYRSPDRIIFGILKNEKIFLFFFIGLEGSLIARNHRRRTCLVSKAPRPQGVLSHQSIHQVCSQHACILCIVVYSAICLPSPEQVCHIPECNINHQVWIDWSYDCPHTSCLFSLSKTCIWRCRQYFSNSHIETST